jgi:hypothetical protein
MNSYMMIRWNYSNTEPRHCSQCHRLLTLPQTPWNMKATRTAEARQYSLKRCLAARLVDTCCIRHFVRWHNRVQTCFFSFCLCCTDDHTGRPCLVQIDALGYTGHRKNKNKNARCTDTVQYHTRAAKCLLFLTHPERNIVFPGRRNRRYDACAGLIYPPRI